jgi:hypothetical protein
MDSITIKRMVPKFDTDAIRVDLPYQITMYGNTYVGVFYMITEDRLEFKYFDKDGKIKFIIILPTVDDIEVFPFRSLSSDVNIELPELKKNEIPVVSKEDVPVESVEPDMKSFYICDMRVGEYKYHPLFVRNNGDLVINYDFMEKLLYDDNVLITIRLGIKGHSYATHTFESKDVRIHVGGTTLTGKILDEYRNTTTCVEIRADDWKRLEWANVYIKNRKDVTNDRIDK